MVELLVVVRRAKYLVAIRIVLLDRRTARSSVDTSSQSITIMLF